MKTYAKLLGKCVAVMAPLIVLCIYFSKCTLHFVDGEAPSFIWNREVANANQDKYYDTIILGDSAANAAYMPEVLSDGTINLSLPAVTPLGNYFTLQEWLEHHEPPKVCYISYNDSHLNGSETFWTRTTYAHRYDLKETVAMLREAVAAGEATIASEHYILDLISYEAWLPNKYITAFLNASFNQRLAQNTNSIEMDTVHMGRFVGRTTKQYVPTAEQTIKTFGIKPLFENYYKKLIELCIENDIQVRLIRLPVSESCVFTDEYRENFYAYYGALQEEYPEISVDWFPLYQNECFTDTHHMNNYGALCFSTELKKLHPEDFGDELPAGEQIAGINDYISAEADLDHLFDWTAGRGYTVLLYDAQDVVPARYGEGIGTVVSDVPLAIAPLDTDGIYAVTDGGKADVSVTRAKNGTLTVQVGGGEPVPWAVNAGVDLSVLVIDRFGGVACSKSFDYTEGAGITLLS